MGHLVSKLGSAVQAFNVMAMKREVGDGAAVGGFIGGLGGSRGNGSAEMRALTFPGCFNKLEADAMRFSTGAFLVHGTHAGAGARTWTGRGLESHGAGAEECERG